jgi:hypothetical protein
VVTQVFLPPIVPSAARPALEDPLHAVTAAYAS